MRVGAGLSQEATGGRHCTDQWARMSNAGTAAGTQGACFTLCTAYGHACYGFTVPPFPLVSLCQ